MPSEWNSPRLSGRKNALGKRPLNLAAAIPLQCGYPVATPKRATAELPGIGPLLAPGTSLYFLITVLHAGSVRAERSAGGRGLVGLDPSPLPPCVLAD